MMPEGQKKAVSGHDQSMVVTAGAGTGKTHVLVQRYLALLHEQGASVGEILALTFTDKAAAEMRRRIRDEIRSISHTHRDGIGEDLIVAPIMTFHAFCATVLREYPEKAGIIPGFAILDEIEASTIRTDSFDDLLAGRTRCPDPVALERVLSCTKKTTLFEILEYLYRNRDQSDVFFTRLEKSPEEIRKAGSIFFARERDRMIGELVKSRVFQENLQVLCVLAGRNTDVTDRAIATLQGICEDLAILSDPSPDFGAWSTAAQSVLAVRLNAGSSSRWMEGDLERYREAIKSLRETLEYSKPWLSASSDPDTLHQLTSLDYLRDIRVLHDMYCGRLDNVKEIQGALDFDDLIRYARRLIESDRQVTAELSARYRFILVDEFQDTDPAQFGMILSVLREVQGDPNRLFIVGDPKQSIYLFRNADVTRFREAAERVKDEFAGGGVFLDMNFRSAPELVTFANAFFSRVFARSSRPWEFEYQPVTACDMRLKTHGSIEILAIPEEQGASSADVETDAVARRIQALAEQEHPQVWETCTDGTMTGRPAGYGDIALLIARRTNLAVWTAALTRYGVPFHVHAGTGFFARQEVMDLANLLGFLARPHDDMALLGALRSPFLGISDEVIFRISEENGVTLWQKIKKFNASSGFAGYAARVEHILSGWINLSQREPLMPFIRRILSESGVYTVYAALPDGPQILANLEKIVSMAGEGTVMERGLSLLQFSDRLTRSINNDDTSGQAQPEDLASDRVNIMTIHAAKGLEFPIVFVPELSRIPRSSSPPFMFGPDAETAGVKAPDPDREYEMSPTPVLAALTAELREKESAEYRRLLYVAFTRARDHLILSGTTTTGTCQNGTDEKTGMALLLAFLNSSGTGPDNGGLVTVTAPGGSGVQVRLITDKEEIPAEKRYPSQGAVTIPEGTPDTPARENQDEPPEGYIQDALISVSRLEQALKSADSAPVPAWVLVSTLLKDSGGQDRIRFGKAVHEVFEGRDAAVVCRQYRLSETEASLVQAYYGRFLHTSLVHEATETYTELPVITSCSGQSLSGVIDRLVRTRDGSLAVIDYKTGSGAADDKDIIREYCFSISIYCHAVAMVTHEPVSGWIYHVEEDRMIPIPLLPQHQLEEAVARATSIIRETGC